MIDPEQRDVVALTDTLNEILNNYDGGDCVDLDAWHTADVVRVQTIMDSELQRRAQEQIDDSESTRH